jgi:putative ABC transport system permease protein
MSWRRWFGRRPANSATIESQVRDEIDTHVAMAVEHLVARGMPRDEAEREARARFGDFDAALDRMYQTAHHREVLMRRRNWWDDLRQDVRLGIRQFRRSPRFTASAALTLALGVGANGAVFSILQSTLLQPLPYDRPNELAIVGKSYANPPVAPPGQKPYPNPIGVLTSPQVMAWRRMLARDVGDIAALITWRGNLETQFDLAAGDRALRLRGARVTPNFFGLLGVRAGLGRLFDSTDVAIDAAPIVISDALWRREFGASSAIVGRAITLAAGSPRGPRSYIVVGVLPAAVRYTYPEETEVWSMMTWSDVEHYEPRALSFSAVIRLRPGVSVEAAGRRATEFREALVRPNETARTLQVYRVLPMREWIVGDVRPSLELLGAVAALLLIVTCVTVANGLLARVSERRHELAVRTALGAGRSRLVSQLVTEGTMLSLMGVAGGIVLAATLQPVLRALLPASVPRIGEIGLGVPVIAFGAVMAFTTTILAAVAPAMGGSRLDAARHLSRASSADRSAVRWRQMLVGAQAAIATTLLVAAALLLTSFWRLKRVDLGFDGERVVTVEMRLLDPKYRRPGALAQFQTGLLERLRAIPGMTEVGLTSAVPFRGVDFTMIFGRPATEKTRPAKGRYVDPGYFDVLRVPLVRGRLFTNADREGTPLVTVVSESYARAEFGSDDPIGKVIVYDRPMEIVGVVRDLRYTSMDNDPFPAVYLPRAQWPSSLICIVARLETDPAMVVPAIHRAIRELDPVLPAMNLTTIDRIVDASVANRRFYTLATASFASIALLLTIVGLVVVVSRVVAERRQELAIRAALGATLSKLASTATRDALVAVTGGVGLGVTGVYVGAALLEPFLFQMPARPTALYAAVAMLVIGVAAAAAWVPVKGFTRQSLVAMLRAE